MLWPRVRDGKSMSSVTATAERLIRETMIEHRVKKPEARNRVAREVGLSPGTLENLARGRLVNVERVSDRINAYLVRALERNIAQLEAELATSRLIARRPDEHSILAAQAALDEEKRLIRNSG
jgi:hypothetical protein